jgi:uncharacterized protein YegP (UPF0339 family)
MKTTARSLIMALILFCAAGLVAPRFADAQDKKDKAKAATAPATTAVFEVYKDRGGDYRFRLKNGEGHIMAVAGKGYDKKEDCLAVIDAIKKDAAKAKVEDEAK